MPTPDWGRTLAELPPWIRERLFCYHANRLFPHLNPPIERKGIDAIASSVDPSVYEAQLKVRIGRYLRPPTAITVEGSESWFSKTPLGDLVGPPFRVHELDLHAVCPLQFYFYQFLYLWTGDSVNRDWIPEYSRRPQWRLGRLPRKLSYIYTSDHLTEKLGEVISAKLPNRQDNLSTFASLAELNASLSGFEGPYDLRRIVGPIEDEWHLVRQEKVAKISRTWHWETGGSVVTVGKSAFGVKLPPHRVDAIQGSKMILIFVNFSRQIRSPVRGLYYGKEDGTLEPVGDRMKDHRLPLLMTHYAKKEKVASGVYIELYDGDRKGYYYDTWLRKHKGEAGFEEELAVGGRRLPPASEEQVLNRLDWDKRMAEFESGLSKRVEKMLPAGSVTYESSESPAVCEDCVYNELCQIPRMRGY